MNVRSSSKPAFSWVTEVNDMEQRGHDWIESLGLQPHPEGGYFAEVYRSEDVLGAHVLPERFGADRAVATSIYYLLDGEAFSALHRIQSDEIWHFHDGTSLTIEAISPDGQRHTWRLGLDVGAGERPMAVVPAGYWFGAYLTGRRGFALVGCTVAPGFDFRDFELAQRADLSERFAAHRELIELLTH